MTLTLSIFQIFSKIEVFIYSVEDVNIDITTRLNKQINRLVEDLGFEKGTFDMIVSSPGIERKLKSFRHFELSIGELIKVKLFDPINDIYTFEGNLVSVGKETIVLKTETTEIEISFSNIKNAKIEFKKFKERVKG